MAVYDLEEQEQIDELKTWWTQYGNLVTGVLLVVALAMAGWQSWNWWQRNQAAHASALYAAVERAAGTHDAKKARDAAGELIDKYASTSQAGMAALLSARLQVDAADIKTAKAQLGWALENARDPGLRELARLRLASLLLDEQGYDEALKLLASEPTSPFVVRNTELKADVLAAQGKMAEAKAAYEKALSALDTESGSGAESANNQHQGAYREMLQIKMESLNVPEGKNP